MSGDTLITLLIGAVALFYVVRLVVSWARNLLTISKSDGSEACDACSGCGTPGAPSDSEETCSAKDKLVVLGQRS
jgi:hypothetical protein